MAASARSRRTWAASIAALLLLGLCAQTLWVRPLVQRVISERSGRSFEVSAIYVGLSSELEPSLTMRDLRIDNADWGAPRPFVRAGVVRMTFAWRSLWQRLWLVSRLDLLDASVELERRANGLRNWRVFNPDYRRPGTIRIQSLNAVRSDVRFVDEAESLELRTRIDDLPTDQSIHLPNAPSLPLVKRLAFDGRRADGAISGSADVSEVLTFTGTGIEFAAAGEARASGATLSFSGTAADVARLDRLDVEARLSAPSLAASATANVTKRHALWQVTNLHGTLGRSDVAGEVRFAQASHGVRAALRVVLHSHSAHIEDLRSLMPPHTDGSTARWSVPDMDGELSWQVETLQSRRLVAATALQAFASWQRPATTAGGTEGPTRVSARARVASVQLDRLWPSPVSAVVRTEARMSSNGDSVDELLRGLTGTVSVSMIRGSVPKALDARLGLDGLAIVGAMVTADERVPIRCASMAVDFNAGTGRSRHTALETDRAIVVVNGTLDAATGSLNVAVEPQLKRQPLVVVERAARITGSLRHPSVAIVRSTPRLATALCQR